MSMETKRDWDFWLDHQYPCTVTKDRYTGAYSNGTWTAWPLEAEEVPDGPWGCDITAMDFWDSYEKPVGRAETPELALHSLRQMVQKYRRAFPDEE